MIKDVAFFYLCFKQLYFNNIFLKEHLKKKNPSEISLEIAFRLSHII